MDEELYKAHIDTTPCKTRKGSVFGSLEKVFNMLTPKKQRGSSSDGPRKVKVSKPIYSFQEVCVSQLFFHSKIDFILTLIVFIQKDV